MVINIRFNHSLYTIVGTIKYIVAKDNVMYVDIDNRGLLTINDIPPKEAQRLLEIIQQADTQLLSRPIETLKKQLHLHLKEYVFHVPNKKP